MTEPDALECLRNDNAVCPYCGYEQSDTHELFGGKCGDGTSTVIKCGQCFNDYEVFLNVDISYTTKRMERKPE